jgi:hypothetical protein
MNPHARLLLRRSLAGFWLALLGVLGVNLQNLHGYQGEMLLRLGVCAVESGGSKDPSSSASSGTTCVACAAFTHAGPPPAVHTAGLLPEPAGVQAPTASVDALPARVWSPNHPRGPPLLA